MWALQLTTNQNHQMQHRLTFNMEIKPTLTINDEKPIFATLILRTKVEVKTPLGCFQITILYNTIRNNFPTCTRAHTHTHTYIHTQNCIFLLQILSAWLSVGLNPNKLMHTKLWSTHPLHIKP